MSRIGDFARAAWNKVRGRDGGNGPSADPSGGGSVPTQPAPGMSNTSDREYIMQVMLARMKAQQAEQERLAGGAGRSQGSRDYDVPSYEVPFYRPPPYREHGGGESLAEHRERLREEIQQDIARLDVRGAAEEFRRREFPGSVNPPRPAQPPPAPTRQPDPPTPAPAPEPPPEPTPEPAAQPYVEPAAESYVEPAPEPTPEPEAEPEPVRKPAREPVVEPFVVPVVGPFVAPEAEPEPDAHAPTGDLATTAETRPRFEPRAADHVRESEVVEAELVSMDATPPETKPATEVYEDFSLVRADVAPSAPAPEVNSDTAGLHVEGDVGLGSGWGSPDKLAGMGLSDALYSSGSREVSAGDVNRGAPDVGAGVGMDAGLGMGPAMEKGMER